MPNTNVGGTEAGTPAKALLPRVGERGLLFANPPHAIPEPPNLNAAATGAGEAGVLQAGVLLTEPKVIALLIPAALGSSAVSVSSISGYAVIIKKNIY